jgi:hypothetical protein
MFEKGNRDQKQCRRTRSLNSRSAGVKGSVNDVTPLQQGCYGAAGQVQVLLEVFLSVIVHFVTPGGFCNVALPFLVDLSAIAFRRLTPLI